MVLELFTTTGKRVSILNDDQPADSNTSASSNTTPSPTTSHTASPQPYHQPHPQPVYSLPPITSIAPPPPPPPQQQPQPQPAAPQAAYPMQPMSYTNPPTTPPSTNTKTTSAKKYTCHCLRSFTTSGHLARHMRIHTGEKNYVCPQEGCGARFSRQDNCMQHYRTHLGGRNANSAKRRRKSPDSSSPSSSQASTPSIKKENNTQPGNGNSSQKSSNTSSSTTYPNDSSENPLNVFAGVALLQTVQ
ncbi:hypothetical protein TRICI_006311 [Trichomonascus ciferrii]|uniref:C2H2-type domain-containing protein n=1 Tax=Trichomonascus ciferrii TaxID=44093 RepID=A0A642UKM7_9ASCO|nr:hypothetical protein TRICI_006311 [Trichomonascus ciferrii]